MIVGKEAIGRVMQKHIAARLEHSRQLTDAVAALMREGMFQDPDHCRQIEGGVRERKCFGIAGQMIYSDAGDV